MMLYPENLEEKIGFDKIREFLKDACVSALGISFVDKISFSDDFLHIQKLVRQTEEFRKLLLSGEAFPTSGFIDINPHLNKARIEGTFLSEEEFHELKASLATLFKCAAFFKGDEKQQVYPLLAALSSGVQADAKLLSAIEAKVDEKGKLRSNASQELQSVRKAIQSGEIKLRKVLDQILRQAKSQGFTNDDVSLTVRGGRMVIPVNAEHKRRIKGFIHDESASGQTVYLEPAEVLEINNEIKELEYQEKREIIRILTQLTNELRPEVPSLKKALIFLGLMDFIRAKARFAIKTDSLLPDLQPDTVLDWHGARHPLLFLSFQNQAKKVVPLHITLSQETRVLIISGPNAGGKSVCLKTVGLFQYMLQCGLLLPLDEHSKAGVFQRLFIDIGDDQSIENDLSTYSSHLKNMRHFISFSNKRTMVLIDEFGTGTEPHIGGAIAESILEELNRQQVFAVITTHYANLKKFAEQTPGIINGAMRYDVAELNPLYQLEIGRPGSSFALEIARKIGLPEAILNQVKSKIGYKQVQFDQMLADLEIDRKNYQEKLNKITGKENQLQRNLKEYQELKDYLETNRKSLLNDAKNEAKKLVQEANQKIETTIRNIKEAKAEKASTREAREDLNIFKESLQLEEPAPVPVITIEKGEIKEGDLVRIKGQGAVGEVILLKGKDVEIRIGELKSNVKLSRLEKISRKEFNRSLPDADVKTPIRGLNINEKMMNFSPNLDLRGKRAEEMLPQLEAFMDHALMLGVPELRIIHGKGDGILRKIVREQIKHYKNVKSARDEHADRGGAGVTIVEMQ